MDIPLVTPHTPTNMDEVLRRLGARIRKLRKEHKLSLEKLAELGDVHRGTLAAAEFGRSSLGVYNLLKIATALKTTGSELLKGLSPTKE